MVNLKESIDTFSLLLVKKLIEIIGKKDSSTISVELPKKRCNRIKNQRYIYKNKIRIWDGKKLNCHHNKSPHDCKKCKGNSICKHNRRSRDCVECKGTRICKHKKREYLCKKCGGKGLCVHEKPRENCYVCSPHLDKWCKHCKCKDAKNLNYNGYCFLCYCKLHPEENIRRRYMFKENYIHDYLTDSLIDIKFVHNQKINNGCSSKRPDWYIDLFTHVIVIECDENSHSSYDQICENRRMMEISNDFGHRPCIFIRFNPDSYKGKKCFEFDRNKILPTKTWEKRRVVLLNTIKKHINIISEKTVEVIPLFINKK